MEQRMPAHILRINQFHPMSFFGNLNYLQIIKIKLNKRLISEDLLVKPRKEIKKQR